MIKIFQANYLKFSFYIFFLLATSIFPQEANIKGNYKILGISVEGNVSADAKTVIANSGIKVGDEIEVPGDQTISAIKRLWALNIFSDIKIEIEKKVANGVFLLIKVSEYPRIEKYVIKGADAISEDDIKEKINFIRGQIIKPQEIRRAVNKVLDLYNDEAIVNTKINVKEYSFLSADSTGSNEITVRWRNLKDLSDEYTTKYDYPPKRKKILVARIQNRRFLIFDISEGEKLTVRKIKFNGNIAFTDKELVSAMDDISEKVWWKFWDRAKFKKADYKSAKEKLVQFYKKNGYLDFEILSDSVKYDLKNDDAYITINVYEGPQYKIRNIYWDGNSVFTDKQLSQRLGFYKGDVFDYERFNQNLHFNKEQNDVSSLYQDLGYLTFHLDEKEQKVGKDSIDVYITVYENNRFRVGKVSITGNTKTKDKVIRRELYSIPGDYFNRKLIFRSLQQLANLRYFNVEKLYKTGIDYRPATDTSVNLIYKVEEQSNDYFNASVGYSGSFGFSGSIGVTLSNFSILEPFKLGGGQILNFNWQFGVGNYYRTFNLGFTEPWFMDTPTMVGFNIFDTRQQYVYFLSQTGISLKTGRRLKWPDNFFYIQGELKYQYNNVLDGRGWYAEGVSHQYSINATLTRNDIDNPIFPSKGSKISLMGELSGGPFLPGNVDYLKFHFTTDWFRRILGNPKYAFYFGVDLGLIKELTLGTKIQPFDYFYMGGSGLVIATTPLRGYDDRSVGPRNFRGDVIGGRVMTKYTAEFRTALTLDPMPIYVLAFAEAGNTFYDLNSTDFFDLRRSVGVGARILINPIGLIGFDYGWGFDRMEVEGQAPAWLFHFQFGRGF
jgi:outer membrane protein insertion porin family